MGRTPYFQNSRQFHSLKEHFENLTTALGCYREVLQDSDNGYVHAKVLDTLLRILDANLSQTAKEIDTVCGPLELCYYPSELQIGEIRKAE